MFDNTFNIVISGSREFTEYWKMANTLDSILKLNVTKSHIRLFEGGARGIDKLALKYATLNKIEHERFEADWEKYKKRAGILRNIEMIDAGDMVIAFWDGQSKGTKHAIEHAVKKRKRCIIVRIDKMMKVEEVDNMSYFENRRMSDCFNNVHWLGLRDRLYEDFPLVA
jgi:hypothetical protein